MNSGLNKTFNMEGIKKPPEHSDNARENLQHDYETVRSSLMEMIGIANDMIKPLSVLAEMNEDIKAYEAIIKLLNTITSMNRQLLLFSDKIIDVDNKTSDSGETDTIVLRSTLHNILEEFKDDLPQI